MKKLIMVAVIVCVAAIAQAAQVSWGSVAMYKPDGSAKIGANATMYVYLIDASNMSMDGAKIWETYGADVLAGGASSAAGKGTKSNSITHRATVVTHKDTAVAGTTYYAAMIVTYGTGDDMVYYAATASAEANDEGIGMYTVFGKGAIDSADTAKTAWTSTSAGNVPEPTSGLLLLMGMGALALRRKRA